MARKYLVFPLVLIPLLIWQFYFKGGRARQEKNEINLLINYQPKTLDPVKVYDDDSLLVIAQSYETLFQYHYLKRPYSLVPLLSDGMPKTFDQGKRVRFKIKKGVYYHGLSDRSVRAEDFLYQMKRLADPRNKSPGVWMFKDKIKGFDAFIKKVSKNPRLFNQLTISGFKIIDDHTFELHLKRPEPNLLYFFAMTFTSPIPQDIVESKGIDFTTQMIGTGPYVLASFTESDITLKKNALYHEDYYPETGDAFANTRHLLSSSNERLPFIDKVHFAITPEDENKWKLFVEGKVDVLAVPKEQLFDPSKKGQLSNLERELSYFSTLSVRWLSFNMKDAIVGKNLKLREAIVSAIDRDKYIEVVSKKTNLKANSIFNPGILGYSPSHEMGYVYDLEQAKKLLKAAGYSPGELTLTYSTRGKKKIQLDEAHFLKQQLAQIGIELKIQELTFPEFLKKGRAGELQFFTDNWYYDYPEGENLVQLLVSKNSPGVNKSGFSDLRLDQLFKELSTATQPSARGSILRRIEKIVVERKPWMMMMYVSAYIAHYKRIQNFRKSYLIRNYMKYLKVRP